MSPWTPFSLEQSHTIACIFVPCCLGFAGPFSHCAQRYVARGSKPSRRPAGRALWSPQLWTWCLAATWIQWRFCELMELAGKNCMGEAVGIITLSISGHIWLSMGCDATLGGVVTGCLVQLRASRLERVGLPTMGQRGRSSGRRTRRTDLWVREDPGKRPVYRCGGVGLT